MDIDLNAELSIELIQELRRHNLLTIFIKRRVIAEAIADEQIGTEACQKALEAFCKQNKLNDDEALQAFLSNQGLTEADLRWQMERPLRIRQHALEQFRHKGEAHFLTRKNQLDKIVYSLLRVKDPYLAKELFLRIDSGEANFSELAAKFSEGPEKQSNGIIGPASLTQGHPGLAERLRVSQPGELMQPFKIEDWWIVARLENYSPASFDEATAESMCHELFDKWAQEETTLRVKKLSATLLHPATK